MNWGKGGSKKKRDVLVLAEDTDALFKEDYMIPLLTISLNPRQLRGSNFLIRWYQGVWSERRLKEAINNTGKYYAISYGLSGPAPEDPKELPKYFERLEKAGHGEVKRPDLLIFKREDAEIVARIIKEFGGEKELPFVGEESLKPLLERALVAIECENSMWIVENMPNWGEKLRPQRRLKGKLGLPKNAVVPNIIVKDEDRDPLNLWQRLWQTPIHVWHAFYDRVFGISLDDMERSIVEGFAIEKKQDYHSPAGKVSTKKTWNIPYYYPSVYEVGRSVEEPKLKADFIVDKNGHVLPYVRFEGGRIELSEQCLSVLRQLETERS